MIRPNASFATSVPALRSSWIAAAVALVTSWPSPAVSQPRTIVIDRAAVLKSIGDVEQVNVQLFPLASDTGLAFRHVISKPDALNLRLHFSVRRTARDWR